MDERERGKEERRENEKEGGEGRREYKEKEWRNCENIKNRKKDVKLGKTIKTKKEMTKSNER